MAQIDLLLDDLDKMKKLYVPFIILSLVLLGASCSSTKKVTTQRKDTVPELYNELLVGMDFEGIRKKLDSSDVEYSIYSENPLIRGIFRNVKGANSLVSTSVQFDLYFDSAGGMLVKKRTRDVFTGL